MFVCNFFIHVGGRFLKISCKLFSYGDITDPLLDLRSCAMKQMKGIDAMEKINASKVSLLICSLTTEALRWSK